MVCIYCDGPTEVINSRPQKRTNTVWRRRRCLHCNSLVTTKEQVQYEASIVIRGLKGTLQPFSPDKLLISLYKSLGHRKTAVRDAAALTNTCITHLLRTWTTENQPAGSLTPEMVRTTVIACLERFDRVAASHYTAYHPLKSAD